MIVGRSSFLIPLFSILVAVGGCKKDSTIEPSQKPTPQIAEDQEKKTVTLEVGPSGGDIEFGDGTRLSFPQGSLTSQTAIKITRPRNTEAGTTFGLEIVLLEPSGLTLNSPAVLTVPYNRQLGIPDENFVAYTLNEKTDTWERLVTKSQDKTTGTLSLELRHFSLVVGYGHQPADLVLELPGKYLRTGDLMYGITGGWWLPGHVGIYLGSQSGTGENDGQTIIESNLTKQFVGVQYNSYSSFVGSHIYAGARNCGGGLSAVERSRIASYAISKLGKPYFIVGKGWKDDLTGGQGFSCVGLAEGAYEDAGRDLVPWYEEVALTPLIQYSRTVPVSDIDVLAGETAYFQAKGIVWQPGSFSFSDAASLYSSSASNLPLGATFSNTYFTWTPSQTNVGKSYTVTFKVEATSSGKSYTRTQPLTLHVLQGNRPPSTPGTPTPSDNGNGIPLNADLSWACTDPDADPITYDIFFGTSTNPPLVANGDTNSNYSPLGLSYNTLYYWKVIAKDDHGNSTAGPVWRFTTVQAPQNQPPSQPSNPSPLSGASNQPSSLTLSWTASTDPENDPITYDVYLGTDNPPATPAIQGQSETSLSRSGLLAGVTYYWYVVAKDNHSNVTPGPVWSFTTQSGPIPGGLLAYYPFNGNANDATGHGINLTMKDCVPTQDRFGNANQAYHFNGSTSRMVATVGALFSVAQVTLSVWVRPEQWTKNNPRVVAVGDSTYVYNYYSICWNDPHSGGKVLFYSGSLGQFYSQSPFPSDNRWHHLAITFDGTSIKFYLDGAADGTVAAAGSLGTFTSAILRVGNNWNNNDPFQGAIDDVRLYSRALTSTEIFALYHEGGW